MASDVGVRNGVCGDIRRMIMASIPLVKVTSFGMKEILS